jgi:hypothetical protein
LTVSEDKLLKLEWALAGIGIALCAVSVQANGGDLPSTVELKPSPVSTAPATTRGLDGLSPGNRLIAQALYSAQKSATVTGRQPWSLDRVAVARAGGRNWGDVFQEMKQNGLLEAETLGQVVTWYQYHSVTPTQAPQQPISSVVGVKVVTQPAK